MLRRNVLIFHQAALGDFILTWPIALAVARILPQARVVYVTASSKGKLAESVLRLDSADIESGWSALLQTAISLDELPNNVQRSLQNASIGIVFRGGESDLLTKSIQRLQSQLRTIDIITTPPTGRHIVDFLISQTQGWAPLHAASEQILNGIRQRGLSITKTPATDVLIHPGSGGESKRWPVLKYAEIARTLRDSGRSIKFVLGEVETERFKAEELRSLLEIAPVVQPPTYCDLQSEIAAARSFIGNDSGPTHLAAIVGTPTVAIFGPTDPAVWSPIGPKVVVVRASAINDVSIKTVLAAYQSLGG